MRAVLAVAVASAVVASVAAARSQTPALTVTQQFAGTTHYIEGSIGFVRIENLLGRRIAQKNFRNAKELRFFALRPGRYRMVSFQRPCDGNCGVLDPPTDKCSKLVKIQGRATVKATVVVRPSAGCTIRLA
jgi:hypothetical protein